MSPVIATIKADSEDEDEDYVPPDDQHSESDSEKSLDDRQDSHTTTSIATVEDLEEKKRKRDALWTEFQASVTNANPPESNAIPSKTVKIEKRYRFAGEEVIEVVQVTEDSPEANKWPLWKDANTADLDTSSPPLPPARVQASDFTESSKKPFESTLNPDASRPHAVPSEHQPESSASLPLKIVGGKRPGPRKPKTSLGSLPGPSKPKKLTTLDKSAMDWRAHIQAEQDSGSSLKDELEANRRTGGYLEKMEFLKRVEERKEVNLDMMKSSKRRKL